LPLEEIAALFGDQDEVMVYTTDIDIGHKGQQEVIRDEQREMEVAHVGTEEGKPTAEQKESV
jgi:hypothetical protein